MHSAEDIAKRYSNILSTFDKFLTGERNLTHNVAYREMPFLVYAKVLGMETSVLMDYKWKHLNTWR